MKKSEFDWLETVIADMRTLSRACAGGEVTVEDLRNWGDKRRLLHLPGADYPILHDPRGKNAQTKWPAIMAYMALFLARGSKGSIVTDHGNDRKELMPTLSELAHIFRNTLERQGELLLLGENIGKAAFAYWEGEAIEKAIRNHLPFAMFDPALDGHLIVPVDPSRAILTWKAAAVPASERDHEVENAAQFGRQPISIHIRPILEAAMDGTSQVVRGK